MVPPDAPCRIHQIAIEYVYYVQSIYILKNYIFQYNILMVIMRQKGISLTDDQIGYIEDNCIDLSAFVQKAINSLMEGEK